MLVIIGALSAALVLLFLLAMRTGFRPRRIAGMMREGVREALAVIFVMLVIGVVTGIWRVSGTIAVFVYYGVQLISPPLFLLVAFFLSCLLSYSLGTSFGVAGTIGVIFMTLARSGGVNPVITGGVLMSGVFFGDRGSPVSSTCVMVSHLTETDIFDNVKRMMRSAVPSLILCTAVYAFLSFQNPIQTVDATVMEQFTTVFRISAWALIPAALLLILPFFRIPIVLCMGMSIAAGTTVSLLVQHVSLWSILSSAVLGYHCPDAALGAIINGGGMISMWDSCVVILLACSCSGIFQFSGMLDRISGTLEAFTKKLGLLPAMAVLCLAASAIFCNQVIAIALAAAIFRPLYEKKGLSKEKLALDMENTCITVPAFIPWSIICSVPLSLFGTDYRSMAYAVYLYAIPLFALLYEWIRKRTS